MQQILRLKRCPLKRHSGFTLVEIMVVIVIMGILAVVAVPKLFGMIEKSREKTDLAWLFYLRNAVEHQLAAQGYDSNAMTSASASGSEQYYNWTTVSEWLKDKSGMVLFRVERRSQPKQANETTYWFAGGHLSSGEAYGSGFFYDIMNEMGWGEIFKGLSTSDKYYTFSGPFFTSKALTRLPSEGGVGSKNLYHVRIRWASSNPNRTKVEEAKEVIVWLGNGDWNAPLIGNYGTCFSTEPKACQ